MRDQHDYFDYETLIHQARMERSVAIGRVIADGVAWLSTRISRANAALWHPAGREKSNADADTASAHR